MAATSLAVASAAIAGPVLLARASTPAWGLAASLVPAAIGVVLRKCRPQSQSADNWCIMGMASAVPALLSCSSWLPTTLLVVSAFAGTALLATMNFVREGDKKWGQKLTPGPLP